MSSPSLFIKEYDRDYAVAEHESFLLDSHFPQSSCCSANPSASTRVKKEYGDRNMKKMVCICPNCGQPMKDPESEDLGKKYFDVDGEK